MHLAALAGAIVGIHTRLVALVHSGRRVGEASGVVGRWKRVGGLGGGAEGCWLVGRHKVGVALWVVVVSRSGCTNHV